MEKYERVFKMGTKYVPESKVTDWKVVVETDPLQFVHFPEKAKTQRVCKAAVKDYGWNIRYMTESEQTPAVCELASVEAPESAAMMHNPTDEHQVRAVIEDMGVVRLMPNVCDEAIDIIKRKQPRGSISKMFVEKSVVK